MFVSGAIVIAVAPVGAITMMSNRGPGKLEQSLVMKGAKSYVVALDVETGEQRWRHDL